MKRKNKKTAVTAIFAYLLLTTGLWMFIMSYSNSYNKLSTEKITPASITLTEGSAEMSVLEHSFLLDLACFLPESKLYCGLYIIAPDEFRAGSSLVMLPYKL